MRPTLIPALALLTTVLAGCSDDEEAPADPGAVSDNLCETVAPAVPEDWGLAEQASDRDEAEASCTMADEEGDTRLVLTLMTPEPGDVDAAFEEVCDTYLTNPQERDEEQCTATGPVELEGSPATLDRAVLLDDPARVLWVTFRTNDPDHAAEGSDVLSDVEAAISAR